MKNMTKILLLAMLISVVFGDGWKDVYGGTVFTNSNIDAYFRIPVWDEGNRDGGYLEYHYVYAKIFTDIKADTIITDTARIKNLQSETIHLDATYTDDAVNEKEGTLTWNPDDYTVNITTGFGNVLQIGQETTFHAKNADSVTVYSGDVVSFIGAQGGRGLVTRAIASTPALATRLGVVTFTAEAGSNDLPVTTIGKVRGLNTSRWADSTLLYLSADTLGKLTDTPPAFPNYRVLIGAVLRSHATEGVILVQPQIDYTDGVTFQDVYIRDTLTVANHITQAGIYGGIFTHDSAATQSIPAGATYTLITQWIGNDSSSYITPNYHTGKIGFQKLGTYKCYGSFSFKLGTANVVLYGAAFIDGTELNNIHFARHISTANDFGAASFTGFVKVDAFTDSISYRIRHNNVGAINYTQFYGNLNVVYVGN